MLFKTPKTATAMALALGLSAPAPLLAQDAATADLPECMEMVTLPCVTGTGAVVEGQAELDTYLETFPEEAAAAAERALQETAEEVTGQAGEDAPAETDGATDGATDAGSPAGTDAEADGETGSDAAPDTAPEEPAGTGDDGAAPEAADAPASPEAGEPEATAPAPEPVPEAAPETATAPEAVPDEAPEPRPEDLGEAPAAQSPEAADEAAGTAAEAPSTVEDDIPEVSSAVPPETPAEGTVADDIPEVSSAVPTAAPPEEAQGMAVTEETEAPAAAAAMAPESPEGAEVEETVVTEETARTSAEDFATALTQGVAPVAPAEEGGSRRETLQRALAAGIAGAALGALLDQGSEVAVDSGDRLVLRQDDGNLRLFRDENALLRQPGARVRTETFDDGSTRTTVLRDDDSEVVTIRGADGRILRRTRVLPDGREVVLIDDMGPAEPVELARLPEARGEALRYTGDEEALRQALARATAQDVGRSFTLRQIREIDRVRYLAPEVELDEITFATGSAAIQPGQAEQLAALGRTMVSLIDENPGEVFLVEGHTDAVGNAGYNLALSDRRAESVALALTEYFDVPPENLVVQGYGEFDLKVPTEGPERENRRANVRRITPLLGTEAASLR